MRSGKSAMFLVLCITGFAPAAMVSQSLRELKPLSQGQIWECNGHDASSGLTVPLFSVKVVFKNLIRGYRISATWYPSQVYHGIIGPAIVKLQEKVSGRTHIITTNYFSLPLATVSSEHVSDSNTIAPSIDGKVFRLRFPLRERVCDERGEMVNKPSSMPFTFRDVDFDGSDEIVFAYNAGGQRSSNAYQAFSLKCHCPHEMVDYHHPVNGPAGLFDESTTFNPKSMTMTKHLSGGSCGDVYEHYKWYPAENPAEEGTERELLQDGITKYEMGADGQCYVVTYKYTRPKLREVSRVKVK
ncbi:MAG: hypothetical protein ACKOE4_07995 [Candidatus Kapaibacterium sp.]